MHRQILEVAVGLFVISGIVALIFLSFRVSSLGSDNISDPFTISADFDNIGNLKVNAPVSMAGVRIGRVNGIELNPDTYQAEVRMDISGEYNRIPVDSSASINTEGLLGEQFVSLEPGAQPAYLKEGARLRLTQSAVVLENLIGQMLFSNSDKGDNQ